MGVDGKGPVIEQGIATTTTTADADPTASLNTVSGRTAAPGKRHLLLFDGGLCVPSSTLDPFLQGKAMMDCKWLVDTGATTSFINAALARRLSLDVKPHATEVNVTYSDGRREASPGTVDISGVIQGTQVHLSATVATLGAADIIIGMDWLGDQDASINIKRRVVWFPDGSFWCPEGDYTARAAEVHNVTHERQPSVPRTIQQVRMSGRALRKALRKGEEFAVYRLDLDTVEHQLNEIGTGFTPEELAAYNQLLDKRPSLFAERTPQFPPPRAVLHRIQLQAGAGPTTSPMYRMGPVELEELKKILISLLEAELIEPSNSPFSAGVLLVPKPGGKWRLVTDYRKLNAVTVKSKYPLPRIDDIFNRVQGATCFTVIDCADGFWQLRIAPEDCPKTAFATPFGHYQFRVAAMGLCNSPASFQMLMNDLLRPVMGTAHLPQVSKDLKDPQKGEKPPWTHPRQCALAYLDDILVYSKTFVDHLEDVDAVLHIMETEHLSARRAKVRAGRSVPFLGHTLSAAGVATDPEKIAAVQEWPVPRNVKEVRSFLGVTSYYRRFIPRYATIAAPINALLKLGAPFDWTAQCQQAFEALKRALMEAPVLVLPDPSLPFVLATDASKVAIGGVLLQDHGKGLQPVEYISRTMIPAERNYPVHQQELLAVVYCCHQWRHHLLGAQFDVAISEQGNLDPHRLIIHTDHRPLTHLLAQPNLTPRQARWMEYLAQFAPFKIQYVKGTENVVPDALSRRADYWFFEDLAVLHTTCVPVRPPGSPYGAPPRSPRARKLFHLAHTTADQWSSSWEDGSAASTVHEDADAPGEGEGCHQRLPLSHVVPQHGIFQLEAISEPTVFSEFVQATQATGDAADAFTVTSDLEVLISRFTVTEEAALAAIRSHPKQMGKFPCKFQEGRLYVMVRPDEWRLYVPEICRAALLHDLHDSLVGGHSGVHRLLPRAQRRFYWPGMRTYIKRYVRECPSCQVMKSRNTGSQAVPKALPDPLSPWDSVMMDFIGPFKKTKSGNSMILVFVCRLTRMCHLAPCPVDLTAEGCAKLYLGHVFRLHGLSRQFISDRDKLFTAKFWTEFFERLGTKLTLGTAYHSSSTHMVERLNRTVQETMRHYTDAVGSNWEEFLGLVEFSLNNAPQAAHGYTPFFLNYGRHPLTPTDLLSSPDRDPEQVKLDTRQGVDRLLLQMREAHDSAIKGYRAATAKYHERIMGKRDERSPSIEVGDLVLVEGPQIGRFSHKVEKELKTKLRPMFLGPYKVLDKFDDVMFKVDVPLSWGLTSHNFHRDQLKPYHQNTIQGRVNPPAPIEFNPETGEQEDEVAEIVAHRDIRRGRSGVQRQYRIRWRFSQHGAEDSWRMEKELDGCAKLLTDYKRRHHLV